MPFCQASRRFESRVHKTEFELVEKWIAAPQREGWLSSQASPTVLGNGQPCPCGRIFRLQILGPDLLFTTYQPSRGGRDGLLPRTLIEALVVMQSSGESACGSANRCNHRE
jgi:hypothetical protein